MARGPRNSPNAPSLPQVSFEKVSEKFSTQPLGVSDLQHRSYGYNEPTIFKIPASYIRHIEPLESDLARQVEYDMDEQDKEWLDAVNVERKQGQQNMVSYEAFEIIMDRLEKEWFDLTKGMPKLDLVLPSEDSTCAICDDSEGENTNAIVFCDGCNLAVHQDCYGVPYIPEGQWLCRKCTVSPENPVSCVLCPNEGGAFKQTAQGEWVHLLCAIWVPETRVANEVFMEPITGVEKISKQRWKLKCNICDIREGACIQCAKTSCFLAFHATCARKEKLLLPMKSTQGSEPVSLTCYCDKHLPKEQQDARAAALAADEENEENDPTSNSKLSKSARAYAKTYKPGPPLVPAIIMDRVAQYIAKINFRKKLEFLAMVCRYWSLKREARRGAPLLKRLHLEPWTASTGGKILTEEEKKMKLELLRRLREDLERVKELTSLVVKRESKKQKQSHIIQRILQSSVFPHENRFRRVFENIMSADRKDYFKNPVSRVDVPDYFDIVKNPMSWSMIDEKLNKHEYWDLRSFKNDIELVINNALLYNKAGTPFHKTAIKIQGVAQANFAELGPLRPEKTKIDDDGDIWTEPPVGDLEPPLELIKLLVSSDAIRDDVDIVLDDDPLTSLFQYALAREKPPPPPPPPKPPKVPKPKRARKLPYEKKKTETLAMGDEGEGGPQRPDVVLGIRTPRTRRAAAAAAEAEALEISQIMETFADMPVPSTSNTKRGKRKRELTEEVDVEQNVEDSLEDSSKSILPGERSHVRKKRASTSFPSQSDGLPVVTKVDKQDLFKLFNRGWILPANSRRGGRAVPPPVEKVVDVTTRNRKRSQNGPAPSRLSAFSTVPSENQTLEPTSAIDDGLPQEAMDVDIEQPELGRDPDETEDSSRGPTPSLIPLEQLEISNSNSIIPPATLIKAANGTVIIEELDTPSIRREKNRREKTRREEKQRLAALGLNSEDLPDPTVLSGPGVPGRSQDWTPVPMDSSLVADPSSSTPVDTFEAGSDLSSLSDDGGEASTARKDGENKPMSGDVQRKNRPVLNNTRLEGGVLVWAKAGRFPWWPAVIYEADDWQVPPNILATCKAKRDKLKDPDVQIIQFFDKTDSWQCLPIKYLKELGEDAALDEEMIAPVSKYQKWKNTAVRNDCREAYRRALAEMETGSDRAESVGGGQVVVDQAEPVPKNEGVLIP